jgi:hypothetical protein
MFSRWSRWLGRCYILSSKEKVKLTGNTAEKAEDVLPALTATIAVLQAKAPNETENFRTMVSLAVEQAARSTSGPNPAETEMIAKIEAAMITT